MLKKLSAKDQKKQFKREKWGISIIIPTYNRTHELQTALDSILSQTYLPDEVLIVDDSSNNNVQEFISSIKENFSRQKISLRYITSSAGSSAIARNIGAKNAKGEILIFLDDDVLLDKDYIRSILDAYKKHPYIKCIQGHIQSNTLSSFKMRIVNYLHRIFLLDHYKKDSCHILPSFAATYPGELTQAIPCEWISGCNFSCKKRTFQEFFFDENLKRYSLGEDKDLSFRIFKKYPRSLFILPEAKLYHGLAHVGETTQPEFNELLAYMGVIYHYYLFAKNLPKRFPYDLLFMWSLLGKILLNILGIITPVSYPSRGVYMKMVVSQLKALKLFKAHKDDIEKGDLSFFDRYFGL